MSFYSTVVLITIVLSIIMIVHINNSNIVTHNARKGFCISFTIIIFVSFLEWLTYFANGNPLFPTWLHTLFSAIEFSLAPSLVVLWVYAIGNIKHSRIVIMFLLLHAVLEFSSIWTGAIYYIDEGNYYCRGEYYFIYIICYTIAIAVMFFEAYLFSRKYQNRNLSSLIAAFCSLFIGIVANTMDGDVKTAWLSVTTCCVLFYIYYIELVVQSDGLTRLLNRRSYENHLANLNYRTALIIFDIDKFKSVNDTYGHAYGDTVLKKISKTILRCYMSRGLCYRIGGDEFCVILNKNSFHNEATVLKLNNRFNTLLNELRRKEPSLPTVSVGYEIFNTENEVADIIHNADTMMYTNKNSNR
ncbi:GGDEF domain-containing protein [Anaerovibrio lipolyticus]|uniref:GGDEF domain-containing protein n=1 Tax=Anaerovibrio lipolyticus TaxID=82374 RepID=UPI0026EBAD4E|nr:GGDEF domain-containing protein [Anaerovibrio lipolyticus]MBE6105845.1 GGDEF domain-containing protein [Anaerovibrio lipolyticus]